jgi:AraC-like DNA-binding protein
MEEIIQHITGDLPSAIMQFTLRSLQCFAPVVLYISVAFYANPGYNLKKTFWAHLILPSSYMGLLILYYFTAFHPSALNYLLMIIFLGLALFYCLITFFRLRKHRQTVTMYASDEKAVNLFWLERIIASIVVIVLVTILYNLLFSFESLNLFMNVLLLLVIVYIAHYSMRQQEVFPFSEASLKEILSLENETEPEKIKNKVVPDEELILAKAKLNQFMLSRKPYLDPELNLVGLAELFGTTPHRLSYIINTGFNKNFFNFISNYRVEEAKSLLLYPKSEQYSVLGIAFESGFNSKTSFNNTFKKITGLTPSGFKKSGPTL